MTSKLIALIESELPEFFQYFYPDIDCFKTMSLLEKEILIEKTLSLCYPHENQIEQRNKIRILWNLILKKYENTAFNA